MFAGDTKIFPGIRNEDMLYYRMNTNKANGVASYLE